MINFVSKIKRFFRQVRGFLPSPIPVGITAFDAWVDDFTATYPMPTQDRRSVVFTLSASIMHLNETAAYRSKFYFFLLVRAASAKQVAAHQFHQAKLAQQAEATANAVTSDGQQK